MLDSPKRIKKSQQPTQALLACVGDLLLQILVGGMGFEPIISEFKS
jgi:hypothetical protein